ncbi:MAG: NAD(P)-dependent glycerol-3-phosphate dehydrogenase [Chloroflexi bacterium]|nr:NAD(P)-dependent glycerol-3-phosphate dehydrogenase [Chloroflexota bacterium]
MVRIGIVGATNWGTTLAALLANQGVTTWLWARTPEEAQAVVGPKAPGTQSRGPTVPKEVSVTWDAAEALGDADLVIFAVPSRTLRGNLRQVKKALSSRPVLLSAVKGLEKDSGKRMSELMLEELPEEFRGQIAVLSGPNLSREIAQGRPASTVVASYDIKVGEWVQQVLNSRILRVYTNPDVLGVELGGALKNIVAIGAGVCDGLAYGVNAKAAFVTRGLAEITRLGVAAGANPLTFAGLAGLGDLVATCFSPLSRNRRVGEELGKGQPLPSILASLGEVAEGVDTTAAARVVAARYQVEMPIAQVTYRLLFEGLDPRQAAIELQSRVPGPEWPSLLARAPAGPQYS